MLHPWKRADRVPKASATVRRLLLVDVLELAYGGRFRASLPSLLVDCGATNLLVESDVVCVQQFLPGHHVMLLMMFGRVAH